MSTVKWLKGIDHITTGFIIDYEDGNADADDVITGFQYLIDSGIVWHLQGHYHRVAKHLIQEGLCHD